MSAKASWDRHSPAVKYYWKPTAARKPYHGHVGFVSPTAEFTPKSVETPALRTDLVYRLRIVVTDADPLLRQGMPVTIRFDNEEPQP